jgi:hypothetical protein
MNVSCTSDSRHISLVGCERGHVHRCCGGGIAGRFRCDVPQRKTIRLLARRSTLRLARSGRADTWRSGRYSVDCTVLRLRLVSWASILLRSQALDLLSRPGCGGLGQVLVPFTRPIAKTSALTSPVQAQPNVGRAIWPVRLTWIMCMERWDFSAGPTGVGLTRDCRIQSGSADAGRVSNHRWSPDTRRCRTLHMVRRQSDCLALDIPALSGPTWVVRGGVGSIRRRTNEVFAQDFPGLLSPS